jgi:peptidoglycan/xylan/chitin deacetylase (PgdA/CDA1 family)
VTGVPGIVIARRSNGFYIQDPQPDSSAPTSEGVFVFTDSLPAVAIGDDVRVDGQVQEFRPGCTPTCSPSSSDFDNLTITQIAAGAADAVRRPAAGVVVLIYHRVGGDSGLELDLPLHLFEAQAAALAASGRVVSLGDALACLARRHDGADDQADGAADARPVVITFDDGTADFTERALPILDRYRLPVTLYAATSFIDEGRPFPGEGRPVSWQGLADACSTGLVGVGSHTHGHLLLDRLPPADVASELDRSIELIGDHLGHPPLDFAYPKAVAGSAAVDTEVRRRFRSAALAGTRPNPFGTTDPHRLARSPIQRSDGMRWFQRKVDGGMAAEDGLRQALNRWRYAADTT